VGAHVASHTLGLANTPRDTIVGTRAVVAVGVHEATVAVLGNTFVDRRDDRASDSGKDSLGAKAVLGDVGETLMSKGLRDSLRATGLLDFTSGSINAQAEAASIVGAAFIAAERAARRRSRANAGTGSVKHTTLEST